MKMKIIESLINFITKNKQCSSNDIIKYKYGIETLYNLLTKTIVMLIVTYLTKSIFECLLLILIYTSLRLFAYGLHANSSLGCWITTLPIYIFGSILIKHLFISKIIVLNSWLIYTIFVYLWAPADTKKRPLIRESRRKKLKIQAILINVIYFFIIIFCNNTIILNAILYSMILESICICPLSYKITKNQFNNYLYYNGSLN